MVGGGAAIIEGALLGDSGLPRAVVDGFRATGMSHVIAISGLDIESLFRGYCSDV